MGEMGWTNGEEVMKWIGKATMARNSGLVEWGGLHRLEWSAALDGNLFHSARLSPRAGFLSNSRIFNKTVVSHVAAEAFLQAAFNVLLRCSSNHVA